MKPPAIHNTSDTVFCVRSLNCLWRPLKTMTRPEIDEYHCLNEKQCCKTLLKQSSTTLIEILSPSYATLLATEGKLEAGFQCLHYLTQWNNALLVKLLCSSRYYLI